MRCCLILILCVYSSASIGELRIEVTQGLDKPVHVAVVPFNWRGWGSGADTLTDVVNSDLRLSGRFKTTPVEQMLSRPHKSKDVLYRDWRLLKVEYLVVGEIRRDGDNLEVTYELHNIVTKIREHKETIVGAKKAAPVIETKKDTEKKEKVDKSKTIAETDREKLEKKFSKKNPEKLN